MVTNETLEFREALLGDRTERSTELEDGRVGEPAVDEEALFPALHQAGFPERLEVLGSVCHREPALGGKRIDGPLALSEEFEKLEAMRVAERLPDASELPVEPVLEGAMGTVRHTQVIYKLLEYPVKGHE